MTHRPFHAALLALALAGSAPAQTLQVVIPTSQDATIYYCGVACCILNGGANGAGQFLIANYDTCVSQVNGCAMVRFDVAGSVPAGSTIVGARLELTVLENWGSQSTAALSVSRTTQSWTEGPSDPPDPEWAGAPPQTGDVTVAHRSHPTLPWGSVPWSGQDTAAYVGLGPASVPSSPVVVNRVQGWLDQPGTNHGWVLRSQDDLRMASREHPIGPGPTLVVDYIAPCPAPVSFCVGAPNSTGSGATLGMNGSARIGQNDCTLTLAGGVPNSLGFFFFGDQQQQAPWGNGFLCVDGQLYRLLPAVPFTPSGTASRPLDYGVGSAMHITAGSTWNFQCKYRDVAAGGALFNASDGFAVTFCP